MRLAFAVLWPLLVIAAAQGQSFQYIAGMRQPGALSSNGQRQRAPQGVRRKWLIQKDGGVDKVLRVTAPLLLRSKTRWSLCHPDKC